LLNRIGNNGRHDYACLGDSIHFLAVNAHLCKPNFPMERSEGSRQSMNMLLQTPSINQLNQQKVTKLPDRFSAVCSVPEISHGCGVN
jgi:hypothetical protein